MNQQTHTGRYWWLFSLCIFIAFPLFSQTKYPMAPQQIDSLKALLETPLTPEREIIVYQASTCSGT